MNMLTRFYFLTVPVLLVSCTERAPVHELEQSHGMQIEYSKEFLAALAKPPAMLPGDSLVKQPGLPPGLGLREPPFPFPKPEPKPLPDLDDPIPPDLYNLPPPFEGYERGPFVPISERETEEAITVPPFVVSDFHITWEILRTISDSQQIDYFVPNEDELTYTNNHHRLFIQAVPASDTRFTYEILINDFSIGDATHENLDGQTYFFTLPVLDNFTYLTIPGPGRTTKISFRGVSGGGGVSIFTVHFDYHERIRLELE